jgi:AcrR family transcriptional regulator
MTRPSHDIDLKLLAAARALVAERGFAALTVRAAAGRAKVNPGMFHYHFKSKRVFKRRVMESVYEAFFEKFTSAVRGESPLDRLRQSLRTLGRFARDHQRMGFSLIQDAVGGDRDTVEFIAENFPRHMKVILGLAAEAQKAGSLNVAPLPFVMTFILAGVGFPVFLCESFRATATKRPFGYAFRELESSLLSDEGIDRRVDAVLRGLGADQ